MERINLEHGLKIAEVLLLLAALSISIFTVVNQNSSSNQIEVLFDLKNQIPLLNSTIMLIVDDSNNKTNNKFTILIQEMNQYFAQNVSEIQALLQKTNSSLQIADSSIIENSKEENGRLIAQIDYQETINQKQDNKIQYYETILDDYGKRIKDMEKTIEKGEILLLLNKYDKQDIQTLLNLVQNFNGLSDKTSNIQASLLLAQNEIIGLKSSLQNEINSLANVQTNLKTIQNDVTNMNPSISKNTNDISSLQASVSNLQTNLQTAQNDITNLKTSTATNANDISAVKTTLSNVQNSLQTMKNDVTNLNPSITKNTNDISSVQTTLSNVQTTLQNQVNNLQTSNTQTQNEVTLVKTNLQTKITDDENLKRKLNYMYNPDECIIYDDIFQALNAGVIQKLGNPAGWDESSYRSAVWNERNLLRIGMGVQSNGNGLLVDVPESYTVIWIHAVNDRLSVIRVSPFDTAGTDIEDRTEKYAFGFRRLTEIGPDGGPSHNWGNFAWVPIVLRKKGKYVIYSDVNSDLWIIGIAFSKNPWSHAKNSGLAAHLNLNGGSNINWYDDNWNNDILAYANTSTIAEIKVPVIPNGKDKMLYFLEYNTNWEGIAHFSIEINGKIGERLRVYNNNPFAAHCNSKLYCRYVGTKVLSSWIGPNDNFLTVKINMMKVQGHFYFREFGTLDFS